MIFEFTLEGPPISDKAFLPERLYAWKHAVRDTASLKWPTGAPPLDGRITIHITYYYQNEPIESDNLASAIIVPVQESLTGFVINNKSSIHSPKVTLQNLNDNFTIPSITTELAEALIKGVEFLHIQIANQSQFDEIASRIPIGDFAAKQLDTKTFEDAPTSDNVGDSSLDVEEVKQLSNETTIESEDPPDHGDVIEEDIQLSGEDLVDEDESSKQPKEKWNKFLKITEGDDDQFEWDLESIAENGIEGSPAPEQEIQPKESSDDDPESISQSLHLDEPNQPVEISQDAIQADSFKTPVEEENPEIPEILDSNLDQSDATGLHEEIEYIDDDTIVSNHDDIEGEDQGNDQEELEQEEDEGEDEEEDKWWEDDQDENGGNWWDDEREDDIGEQEGESE